MLSITTTTIFYAIIGGTLPAFLWLFFWMREDRGRPKSAGLIVITFILGMLAVILVIPIQKFIQEFFTGASQPIVLWAGVEELTKYFAVALVALHSSYLEEPIDYVMYFIVAGLGFAAMENTLFLHKSLLANNTIVSLLTGNLRFLGSTLLHALSTGIVGIAVGLSVGRGYFAKFFYTIIGIGVAITLHSVFNFFIIQSTGGNVLQVFGFLWVTAVFVIIIIEKLRRMSGL